MVYEILHFVELCQKKSLLETIRDSLGNSKKNLNSNNINFSKNNNLELNIDDQNEDQKSTLEIIDNKGVFEAMLRVSIDVLQKTLDEYKGSYGRGSGPNRTKEFTTAMLANVDSKMIEINAFYINPEK